MSSVSEASDVKIHKYFYGVSLSKVKHADLSHRMTDPKRGQQILPFVAA